MTIDKEQLISLLEEKTGFDREQVEAQLSELINRIQKAAEEGKSFEVEGFGTFNMEKEKLQFEPEATLETEINNKYAGMKPIELIGAFKEPETDEEVPEVDMSNTESAVTDEEDKWAFDAEAKKGENDEKPDIKSEPEPTVEEAEPETVAESGGMDEEAAPAPEVPESEDQQEAEEVFDAVFGSADGDVDHRETKESPEPEKKDKEAVAEEKEEQDPIGTVLVAVVVVLVIGIGGWLIYDLGFSGSGGDTEIATTSSQPTETVGSSDGNTSSKEQSVEEEQNTEPEQLSAVSTEEEENNGTQSNMSKSRYGLRGQPNNAISSGYTIVVHSLRNQQKAEENRQQLQEAGFRALISQAQVQGVMYYRVGLGQFRSVSDAQQAVSEIPDRYQGNNFIKRIQ